MPLVLQADRQQPVCFPREDFHNKHVRVVLTRSFFTSPSLRIPLQWKKAHTTCSELPFALSIFVIELSSLSNKTDLII
jgi:hypothetical protein